MASQNMGHTPNSRAPMFRHDQPPLRDFPLQAIPWGLAEHWGQSITLKHGGTAKSCRKAKSGGVVEHLKAAFRIGSGTVVQMHSTGTEAETSFILEPSR